MNKRKHKNKVKHDLQQNQKHKEQWQMLNTTTSMKDGIQKFTRVKNKHAQNQSQLGREQTITEDPSRTEQNISNKNNITQINKGRKSLAQDKTCYGCNCTEYKISKCTKKMHIVVMQMYQRRCIQKMHYSIRKKGSYGMSFGRS